MNKTESTNTAHGDRVTPNPSIKRRRPAPFSLAWAIPVGAAMFGLCLLIYTLMQAGPEITVSFSTADGLVPGKTAVRYKAMDVGVVKSIRLASDRSKVIATVSLVNGTEDFLARDSRFWVVRPRLAVSGISGLETLLSGAYIGVDAGRSPDSSRSFAGLEAPPAITQDEGGRQFRLEASDLGSLGTGSPVYFRKVQVGQVVAYKLSPSARHVWLTVFIKKPFDKLVNSDTRFWHASGVNIQLDASGVKLTTESLATMLLGGIAFQDGSPDGSVIPAPEDAKFTLATDQAEAMKTQEEQKPITAVLNFNQSLRGLVPGAPVDFRGIVIGRVKSFSAKYDRTARTFVFPVIVELYPGRLGIGTQDLADRDGIRTLAHRLNRQGMRAQLRNGNLLTGQLYIAFDFFPKAAPARLDLNDRLPEIATIPGGLEEIQTHLGSIAAKLDKVPFDALGRDLQGAMAHLDALLGTADKTIAHLDQDFIPQATASLGEARKTFEAANAMLASDAPLPQETRHMIEELTRAANSLRSLTDYLNQHPEAVIRGRAREAQ